ncbi:hypothetical protein BC941DRAFT_436607 [Chlamydoabsidia padenii]|nr:hypothetical protein BC941DRAFT_436607 [Chlamydoabsidia padenii]
MMNLNHSTQTNIITLHDAITDSPIYRAFTLHFDNQIDLFSQWIVDLAHQTKSYAEKLKELNAETTCLANKLIPTTMVDDSLIDSKVIDLTATNFGEALKTNLTFKIKMVSDLEDNFTRPIQQFANKHIHGFKIFRTQHKQALMKYENVLARYATQQDTTSLDQQQLESSRKKYMEMSSEHVLRIIKLRHELEHCLVEQFSATTTSRKDFYSDAQIWKQLDTMLFSWTEWLVQDKQTGRLELEKLEVAKETLEKEYLEGLHNGFTRQIKSTSTSISKSGYLFVKSTDGESWHRQWFFVLDGYFGSCKVVDNETRRIKMTVDDCVSLHSCTLSMVDRRFCFELISKQDSYKSLFMLQAENQQDMDQWVAAIRPKTTHSISSTTRTPTTKKSRPSSVIIGSYDASNDQPRSPALLIAKSKSTTVVSTPSDIPVTLSINNASGYSNLSNLSSSPVSTIHSSLSRPQSVTSTRGSLRITCTDDDIRPTLAISTLLGQLFIKTLPLAETVDHLPDASKLWGTLRSFTCPPPSPDRSSGYLDKEIRGKTVWPIQHGNRRYVTPDIPGYASHLDDKNQQLRQLFNGVSHEEVVMDVFMASFLKKQDESTNMPNNNLLTTSSSGYHYGGSVYATQTALWFYSNLTYNCVTAVALKWEDVEDIQVSEDAEIIITVADGTRGTVPVVFSLIMDDTDTVAQKLRFLVNNAKLSKPMPLYDTYQKVIAMSISPPSLSSSSSTLSSSSSAYTQQNSLVCLSTTLPHKMTPHSLSTRMASSETTSTVNTTRILITEDSKKAAAPSFVDPDALPDHITKPTEPITCNCDDHLDRCDTQVELPISAKRLFHLMFSDELTGPPTNGGVWNNKTEGIKGRDLRVTLWENDKGEMKRTLKYWMPVANPVVRMNEAEVVETQVILKKEDYLCYVVQISTKTEALPFADAFVPSVRYCITYLDDSRCKLSCSLGVKWLKWIMAKIIVTKAALSGMSTSIKVFVPILEEAACVIQKNVDDIRQLQSDSTESTTRDGDTTGATTIPTFPSDSAVTATIKVPSQLEPPNNRQPESLETTINTTCLLSTLKSKATAHLQRFAKLINVSNQGISVCALGLWVLSLILVAWLLFTPPAGQHQVTSHAVYLRDLDEGFITKSMQPPYSGSKSYDLFIQTRRNEQEYTWYDGRHYKLGLKYRGDREQLGILRHSLLGIFQALNTEDAYLLENEYLNWLLDNRQRCRDDRKRIQQNTLEYNDTSSYMCDQVTHQIGTYF